MAHVRLPRRGGFLAALIVLLLAVPAASAQNVAAVDSLARAFAAQQQPAGLVVGLTGPEAGTRRVFTYGVASLEDSTDLTSDTRFEIGSLTKLFTALLLAERAERGAVALDDPIGRYLPDSVRAPTYEGQPIRLHHLATHTSGLPRLPDSFAPADPSDPYADYTPQKLYAFLDGYELTRAPGAGYAYSNLGAGLLGHLLARQADTTYPALLRRRVLRPLGLAATDTTDAGPLAQGYAAPGQPAPYWHWDALSGAGTLRSSAADMLRFVEQQLRPERTPLAEAIRQTQEERHRANETLALGLGWHVSTLPNDSSGEAPDETSPLYLHTGGTGGARSFVGFVPGSEQGLVVLANGALPLNLFGQFSYSLVRAMQQR